MALLSDYTAMKKAIYENHAVPSAVISPDEVIGEEERDRLEAQWNHKFRRGGSGQVVIGESGLKVQVLSHSMGDLAALADMKATKEDICNAFHVPLSFLTTETNLANLQAAEHQHLAQGDRPPTGPARREAQRATRPAVRPVGPIVPRQRRSGAGQPERVRQQEESDLKLGVVTINEVRAERGLPPVPWGDTPWLPLQWAPTDFDRTELLANSGRNRHDAESSGS